MMNVRARVIVDWLLIISFAVTALTGIILLLYPHNGMHRSWRTAEIATTPYARPEILRIHMWSGIAFVVLGIIHLTINWTCLKNMTRMAMKTQ